MQLVFSADLYDDRPVFPLIEYKRVADLQGQQRFHGKRSLRSLDAHADRNVPENVQQRVLKRIAEIKY